jgi:hypothetical protein
VSDLLVLANSFKNGERCLAGVDEDDTWIRPVADQQGGGIPSSRLMLDGRPVWPGDVVSLVLEEPVPLTSQCENVILGTAPLELQPALPVRVLQDRLKRVSLLPPGFAENPRKYVSDDEYQAGTVNNSLALLYTDSLKIRWRTNSAGNVRPRAIFMSSVGGWDIPYTGEQWEGFPPRVAGSELEFGPTYVTVSVGEPIPGQSDHWVLAAGALPAT